jgi:hypothetical protein
MQTDNCIKFVLIIFAGIVTLYLINEYNTNSKKKESETFSAQQRFEPEAYDQEKTVRFNPVVEEQTFVTPATPTVVKEANNTVMPILNEAVPPSSVVPSECFPRDKLSASDLLPRDAIDTKWAQANPTANGSITDQNLLSAGYHIGINTVGSSLRNPNYDLRAAPPNPQLKVSPWMMSTIAPDTSRRPLDGFDC